MSSESKYSKRSSRRLSKNSKRKRMGILFLSVLVIAVLVTGFLKFKVFNNSSQVQATTIEDAIDNADENLANNNENVVENSKIEDGKYIEKYIYQQRLGQMPDGADGKKVVYLTFDDGPSENVTPEILDILKEENVQATFFVLGQEVDKSDKRKEVLKRQVQEGHSIGIHTYTHEYRFLYPKGFVNVDNFMSEVEKTKKTLKNVLGDDFDTKIVRLPGGHMSWKGTDPLDARLEKDGYCYIDWNSMSKDAEDGGIRKADELYKETITSAGSKEKVVILMHDKSDKKETAKVLPEVIHYFKEKGYEFKVIK